MHFTETQFATYWNQGLSAADLLAFDAHLTECPACRDGLWQSRPGEAPTSLSKLDDDEHLDYARIAAAAEGAPPPAHLTHCATCQEEVEDLRRFRQTLAPPAKPFRGRWLIGLAAALALLIAGWAIRRPTSPPISQTTPAPVLAFRDGAQTVGLDRDGHLQGLTRLSAADRTQLAESLRTGIFRIGPVAAQATRPGTQLGTVTATKAFALSDPLGRTIRGDRATFRWQAMPGATAYRVQIFGPKYQLTAESPLLTQPEWTPAQPLPPGAAFSWQVTAVHPKGDVRVPTPPAAEARFATLGQEAAERINAKGPSHLALTQAYAAAGLLPEALTELDLLVAVNPEVAILRQLRTQLLEAAK